MWRTRVSDNFEFRQMIEYCKIHPTEQANKWMGCSKCFEQSVREMEYYRSRRLECEDRRVVEIIKKTLREMDICK